MIKSSRKILKFINDNTSSTKGLAASNIATSFKMDLNYVNDVLDYLYEQELIKLDISSVSIPNHSKLHIYCQRQRLF